jgi:hypothetical protein
MTQEALKLALNFVETVHVGEWVGSIERQLKVITAIKEALALQALHSENERLGLYKDAYAEPEQEPVAWLLTDKNINSLQVDSIQRLIDRLKHAHNTDLCVRINGQDEWFQADWLKHMVRVTLPQRTWVGLTSDEISNMFRDWPFKAGEFARAIEAKLKERNT